MGVGSGSVTDLFSQNGLSPVFSLTSGADPVCLQLEHLTANGKVYELLWPTLTGQQTGQQSISG
jgi:hypothetical protein